MLHLRRVGAKPAILSLAVLGLAFLLPASSQGQANGGFTANKDGYAATFYFLDSSLASLVLKNTSTNGANLTGIYFDANDTNLSGPDNTWVVSPKTSSETSSLTSLLSAPGDGVAAGASVSDFTINPAYKTGLFDFEFKDGNGALHVIKDAPTVPEIPGAAMACFLLGTVPLMVRLKRNKSRQEA